MFANDNFNLKKGVCQEELNKKVTNTKHGPFILRKELSGPGRNTQPNDAFRSIRAHQRLYSSQSLGLSYFWGLYYIRLRPQFTADLFYDHTNFPELFNVPNLIQPGDTV